VTRTREIYEQAIASLPEKYVTDMCIKYADLEKKLGEIDRARAIYVHASQYCDPRAELEFWNTWHAFEVRHGSEETFREMRRVKRSVQAQFNTQINFMSAEMLAASKKDEDTERRQDLLAAGAAEDEMAALERQAAAAKETEAAKSGRMAAVPGAEVKFTAGTVQEPTGLGASNPEEISIGEDQGEEAPVDNVQIQQKKVPDAVFGGLSQREEHEEEEEPMGALARLRARGK